MQQRCRMIAQARPTPCLTGLEYGKLQRHKKVSASALRKITALARLHYHFRPRARETQNDYGNILLVRRVYMSELLCNGSACIRRGGGGRWGGGERHGLPLSLTAAEEEYIAA